MAMFFCGCVFHYKSNKRELVIDSQKEVKNEEKK